MTSMIKALGLDKLTVAERRALANELWDSTEVESESTPISDEFRAELRRRAEEADLHPENGIPWEVVKAEGRLRFKK